LELVTIRTFDNSIQAHLLKSKLESEGITCYLFDENIVGLNPLYNITIGGIKLKINKFDMDKASMIIQQVDQSTLTNDQGESLKCPNCHSVEIYSGFKSIKGIKGILSVIISFLLIVFPIYFKTVKKCKECGYEFK